MIADALIKKIAFPLVEKTTQSRFWSLYRKSYSIQSLSEAEIIEFQANKLGELLSHATDSVPLWKDVKHQCNLQKEDLCSQSALSTLGRLPITTKTTYSRGFPDQVTSPSKKESYQYLSSSGTTDRMTVVTNFRKRDHLRAAEHLAIMHAMQTPLPPKTLDIPPSSCNIVCGLADAGPEPLGKFIFWSIRNRSLFSNAILSDIKGRIERQLILKRRILPPLDPADWQNLCEQIDPYIDLIVAQRIEVLRGLPMFLYWIALRVQERKLTLDTLKVVIPYGGLAADTMVSHIEQLLDVCFINNYGTGEVGAIGCARREKGNATSKDVIYTFPSMVFAEVLDDDGQPVGEEGIGRLVVTDLNNTAMPIIRYDIGDTVQVIKKFSNSCLAFRILGRKHETFRNQDGHLITARILQNLFLSDTRVLNYRLDQIGTKKYRATIAVRETFDTSTLAQQLMETLGLQRPPTIKVKPFLLPEGSGKYLGLKQLNALQW